MTPKTIPFYLSCEQRNSIDLSTDHILFSSLEKAKTKKHNAASRLLLERLVGNFLVLTNNDVS